MSGEKRDINGYKELRNVRLARREIILAEKAGDENPYLVCSCKWDNPLGADEFYDGIVTDDYLEAVGEFIKRESELLKTLENERQASGLSFQTLTIADCVPKGLTEDIKGKLIIIKPEKLSPEYRTAEHQLVIALNGNGTSPDARGNAVYAKTLYSGETSRYERYNVAGVADPAKLPSWAVRKMALTAEEENENEDEEEYEWG